MDHSRNGWIEPRSCKLGVAGCHARIYGNKPIRSGKSTGDDKPAVINKPANIKGAAFYDSCGFLADARERAKRVDAADSAAVGNSDQRHRISCDPIQRINYRVTGSHTAVA